MSAHDAERQLGVLPATDTPGRGTVRLGLTASMVVLAGVLLLAAASGTAAAQEATNVTVVVEPGETVAGESIGGPPTVLVTDESGSPVEFVEVLVTVAEGPGDFASGSTIEYTDANGEIVFDDLVLDEPGTYRLEFEATSSPATPVTTDAFDVVADPNSIQAMVDAADPGDTIAIAPGTYVENVTVDTPDLTITAAGAERPHVEGGFRIRADGVTISGMDITEGYGNDYGIRSEVGNVTITGTEISDTGGQGILISARTGDPTVSETDILSTGTSGIEVRNSGNLTVTGVTISNTSDAPGIYVEQAETIAVSETEIRDTGVGIVILLSGDVTITTTDLRAVDQRGLVIAAPDRDDNVTISEVDVRDTGDIGMQLEGADTVTVSGTNIQDIGERGIYAVRVDEVVVTAVDVRGAGNSGIVVEEATGEVTVSGTSIRETGSNGLTVREAVNVNVTDVGIQGADRYGIRVREIAGEVTVSEANIRNTGLDGLHFLRTGDVTVTDVETQATGGAGIDTSSSGNLTVTGANISNTGVVGIDGDGIGTLIVDETEIRDTEYQGIRIFNSGDVTVTGVEIQATGDAGIETWLLDNFTITGANISNTSGAPGIYVEGAETTAVSETEIRDTGVGIVVLLSGDVTITATGIRTVGGTGVLIAAPDGTDNVTISEVDIRDAGARGISVVDYNTVTVSASNVRGIERHGISVERVDEVTVTDSFFVDTRTAVELTNAPAATLTRNHIVNNTIGVKNGDNQTTIDATNNWWGVSDGPGGEGNGRGDPVIGEVEFEPFLSVTAVEEFEMDADIVGLVHDDSGFPGVIQVTASGFATDEFDVESGVAILEIADRTVTMEIADGKGNTTVYFDRSTKTGLVTADLEGLLQDDLRLVHEAHTLDEGYTRWSIPQPAALYTTDGVTDVTQWRNDEAAYDDAGFSTDDGSLVTDGADLHRGMFVHAETDGERLGYDFATPGEASLPPGGAEPIGEGWNLLGSNYDVSSNDDLTLNHDLATVTNLPATAGDYTGEDDVVAFDPRSYNRLGGTYAVGPYETYWVYVDVGHPTEFRAITAPEYDPADGE